MMVFEDTVREILSSVLLGLNNLPDSVHAQKTRELCQKVGDIVKVDEGQLKGKTKEWLLSHITKIILDYTFCKENVLTDEDFSSPSAEKDILEIIELLSIPEKLANEVSGSCENTLDEELLECLYWRRGALLYMYCCTLTQDGLDSIGNKVQFSNFLADGVDYIQRMLAVRQDHDADSFSSKAADSLELVTQGIYSDTHVLALMYGAELCFWFHHVNGDDTSKLESKAIGQDLVKKFLKIVEGPLRTHQWNTARAKEILQELS